MIVEAQICDAVAMLDAFLPKRGGQALAALAELGVGELALARNDPDLLAKQVNRTMETPDGCQRNQHDRILHVAHASACSVGTPN